MTSSIDALLESFEEEATADVRSAIAKTVLRKISRSGGRVSLVFVIQIRQTPPDAASLFNTTRFPYSNANST